MSATTTDSAVSNVSPTGKHSATKQHIRGSSLLLSGRFISLAVNFAIQVVTVRALIKADYGAFAYALAVVSIGSTFIIFGMDKTISRFVPIYEEHKDYDRMFGSIIMMIGTVVALGAVVVLLTYAFQDMINTAFVKDPNVVALMVVMIALAPLQAMDSLLGSMLTIFSGARAVFLRRFLLNPGLKLGGRHGRHVGTGQCLHDGVRLSAGGCARHYRVFGGVVARHAQRGPV